MSEQSTQASFSLRWGEDAEWLEDDLCWDQLRCLPVDSDEAVHSVSEGCEAEASQVYGYRLEDTQSLPQMCEVWAETIMSVTSASDPL